MTVIRHWLMVRPDGTLDMIDSATVADRLKGEGKRLLGPYVPAEQLQGAVETLRELLPWVERVLPDDNVAAFNAALARARTIVGGQ